VSARSAGTSARRTRRLQQRPAASISLAVGLFLSAQTRPPVTAPPAKIPSPVDLEAFELVVLRRPTQPRDYDEDTLAGIQREHLAYHASLRESGQVVTNGPVADQPDESLRGFTFYRTGSLEEARRLAQADPAVQAGRLEIEVMTWYCPPGTMVSAGKAVTL
jgi:uncharacterized protein